MYLSLVLLNNLVERIELGTRLVKDRHLHSNSLLRLLIVFDVSLEILPKRRKLLVCIFKDAFPSQQGDTIQAYELIIFPKLRIIYPKFLQLFG